MTKDLPSKLGEENEAESIAAKPVIGITDVPIRETTAPIKAVPGTAAERAKYTLISAFGISTRTVFVVIFIEPILTPFPYISHHVVQAYRIGLFLSYRMSSIT